MNESINLIFAIFILLKLSLMIERKLLCKNNERKFFINWVIRIICICIIPKYIYMFS